MVGARRSCRRIFGRDSARDAFAETAIDKTRQEETRMDVKDLRYEFSCLKCPTVVTGTLPEVERHGWVDVSSMTHLNQWICPSCSRGLKPAPDTARAHALDEQNRAQ
jgi:Zn finger protein HypA/HybF involved in hydrogenase expression